MSAFTAGTGHSTEPRCDIAARQATEAALQNCPQPDLAVLFLTDNYDPAEAVTRVREVSRVPELVGFMAGGVLAGDAVLDRGLAVMLLGGGGLQVATAVEEGLADDPLGVGRRLGDCLAGAGFSGGAVLVLPDGFTGGLPEMLHGLYDRMGPDFCYVGGGAGDNLRFYRTYQFTGQRVCTNAVAAAVISGIPTEVGLGHGWRPVGEPVVVGETDGKRVLEIDGRVALEGYAEHVGPVDRDRFAEIGMRCPLGFPDLSGNYVIRDPISLEEDGTITFVTEVPSRSVGYVMKGDPSELIRAAGEVAARVRKHFEEVRFALCFDCISRYLLMREKFVEEFDAIRNALNGGVPLMGALTFGEVGCFSAVPIFHNKTVAVLAGGEIGGDE